LPPSGLQISKEKLLKKVQLTLLVLLTVAAALTVGCGDSNSIPTYSKLPFSSDRVANPATPLFIMNLDGSAVTPVTFTLPDSMYSPSISADFKTVAFTSGGEVWVSNADGTSQTQLTDNATSGSYTYFAKISPDGKKIVFGLWDTTTTTYHFWIMNSDGSGKLNLNATLPDAMTVCYSGSFSADSKQVAFACEGNTSSGIYLTNVDGTHQSTVTTVDNTFLDTPMFSPDGKQILYVSFNFGPAAARKHSFHIAHPVAHRQAAPGLPPNQGIFSINLDGSNATLVVPNCFEAEILNSTLFYTTFNSDLELSQISKSNLDGTGAVSISDGTADDWLALSSD
jgi:Tol biopolymer transport system component